MDGDVATVVIKEEEREEHIEPAGSEKVEECEEHIEPSEGENVAECEVSISLSESEEDSESDSGEESFLIDDELSCQDENGSDEDYDDEEDEKCSTYAVSPKKARFSPRVSRGKSRTKSPIRAQPESSATSWKTEKDTDKVPPLRAFTPARRPGHQLNPNGTFTPMELFKLFLTNDAALVICQNTNKQAAKNLARGKKYAWTDIDTQELFKFLGLTFYFALVKMCSIRSYWKKNTIFSVPFPATVMSRTRYTLISWNIHMSDPDKDTENDKKKGTPEFDRLFRLKPFMDTVRDACKAFYHPRRNISVDERMVATKAHTGMTQIMKRKSIKSGFKLFVLSDSSNGYTLDFFVYTGKSTFVSGAGIAYDSIMSLVKPAYLGGGYHLYMDNFYTSPKLLKDLYSMNIGACGTYRDDRRNCPKTTSSALKKKDPRGTLRWIREDPLVFVKWKDTREVSICSTIHQAYTGGTVQRRVRTDTGEWKTKSIPCPAPVTDYNKYMGGVDLSDQLIQYYTVHHKTSRWYRTLFFHMLDVIATNSYLLHKELCKEKKQLPLSHRSFLEVLTAQLCGVTVAVAPSKATSSHVPVPISKQSDASKRASYGRRTCIHCRQTRQVLLSTPWKCKECDVSLCLIADRNCFEAWHK